MVVETEMLPFRPPLQGCILSRCLMRSFRDRLSSCNQQYACMHRALDPWSPTKLTMTSKQALQFQQPEQDKTNEQCSWHHKTRWRFRASSSPILFALQMFAFEQLHAPETKRRHHLLQKWIGWRMIGGTDVLHCWSAGLLRSAVHNTTTTGYWNTA